MTDPASPALRRRDLAVCAATGLALSFAFPEPSISPLAWVALAPLLVAASGTTPGRGAALGFAFGLGFFGSLIVWVSLVGWVAWTVLVLLQAAFVALFGAGWAALSRYDRRWWLVLAPALWVVTETMRASVPVVGFPWGELAQSQTSALWILQVAGIGGALTVSFLLVAVNVLVARALLAAGRRRLFFTAWAAIVLVAPAVFHIALTSFEPRFDVDALTVGIVQGNAVEGQRIEDERERIERHLALTRTLSGNVDLVVWPESAVAIDPERDPAVRALVGEAARGAGAPMIVGANLDIDADHYQVVALLVSPEGVIVDRYEKLHLVPFGEYVPARAALDWLPLLDQVPRDAVAGTEAKNFAIGDVAATSGGIEIAPVISFEGDFGPLVRDRIAMGAQLLVVATNTSTWGRSWASAQHVAMSQVRAAETGVPVVHAALSGISAFIDPTGRVIEHTGLYEEAALTSVIGLPGNMTFYARTGEWFPMSCALIVIVVLGRSIGTSTRRRRSSPEPPSTVPA